MLMQAEASQRIGAGQLSGFSSSPALSECCGSISPRLTALAVVQDRPISRASDFISAMVPPPAAATMESPLSPTREESPTRLMMWPFFRASMKGAAAWHQCSKP